MITMTSASIIPTTPKPILGFSPRPRQLRLLPESLLPRIQEQAF
jgi:hypothetical protein